MSDSDLPSFEPTSWAYFANLYLTTPLEVLRHHGRKIPADGIRMEYGRGGAWWPQSEAITLLPHAGGVLQSCGGQVPPDGGDVLPFLIAYRTIVENESRTIEDRTAAVRELLSDPTYARFIRLLGDDVATDWVASRLSDKLNIGSKAARALVEHGFVDVPAVLAVPDADLRGMPGVGAKTIATIRLARRKFGIEPPK